MNHYPPKLPDNLSSFCWICWTWSSLCILAMDDPSLYDRFITIKTNRTKLILFQEFSEFSWEHYHLLFIIIWIVYIWGCMEASTFFLGWSCCSSFFLSASCTSYAIKLPIRFSNNIVERLFASSIAAVFFSQSDMSAWRIFFDFFHLSVFLSKGW